MDIMKNFEQICCGQPIEGMKGRPDGCIVDINDSGVVIMLGMMQIHLLLEMRRLATAIRFTCRKKCIRM